MLRALFALLLLTAAVPALAQRVAANVECKPAGRKLTYDCTIKLTEASSGTPISGAKITVGADMPSMPMAHSMRPVPAKAGAEPGTYGARLELEMRGEWAVKMRVSGPVQDQVIKTLRFEGP